MKKSGRRGAKRELTKVCATIRLTARGEVGDIYEELLDPLDGRVDLVDHEPALELPVSPYPVKSGARRGARRTKVGRSPSLGAATESLDLKRGPLLVRNPSPPKSRNQGTRNSHVDSIANSRWIVASQHASIVVALTSIS